MTGPFADRLFRIAFAAAGIYNLAFGLWAGFWPLAFFQLFEIAPPRYPGIWACLGMVVGVYGLLYLHAAWKLETAWPIIAVGFLGKVLGPIGMATSFSDEWPRRLGMMCVCNDLIWWLPFGLFLLRGTWLARLFQRLAPWICIATHLAALVALAFWLQPGTLVQPDVSARETYVGEYSAAWSLGWGIWMAAAASITGFYAWWGGYLEPIREPSPEGGQSHFAPTTPQNRDSPRQFLDRYLVRSTEYAEERPASEWRDSMTPVLATIAVVLCALGMVGDFSGEGSAILRLVELARGNVDQYARVERQFTLLSPGAANGLYTIGGVLLTLITPGLPRWVRASMWITWLAGVAMTIAAFADSAPAIIVSTAVLFPPLLVWMAWMGARWRPA